MTDDDIVSARTAARLNAVLPDIAYEIERMSHAAQNEVFALIRAGKLTPELAYAKWLEVFANVRLLNSLEKKAKLDPSVAKTVTQGFALPT